MKIETKLLLKPEDFKPSFDSFKIEGVFNPAAVRLPNKKIFLYVRVAEVFKSRKNEYVYPQIISRDGYVIKKNNISLDKIKFIDDSFFYLKNGRYIIRNISHFRKVVLDESGFKIGKIEQKPSFTGISGESDYGVEDPRIVKIKNKYFMTYVSVSLEKGVSSSLAVSFFLLNLKKWSRKGIIFREQNKDVVLFPEKINNKYVFLHRPSGVFNFTKPSIWISYSKDLVYFGKEEPIIKPRENSWDSEKVGSGPPPIKTKKGWLLIYHGVSKKSGKNVYCAGAVLLDLKNPEKILARTPKNRPLFKPEEKYEKKGFVDNVVFPTGLIKDLNNKDLLIYSGAADKYITVKKIPLNEILDSLEYLA